MLKKIIIEDYNPEWKIAFKKLKEILLNKVEKHIVEIEHVGSTSIEGLAAKPIIDIDIIVKTDKKLTNVIELLNCLGYKHLGNRGIEGREAFERIDERVPFDGKSTNWIKHHLYVCKVGTPSLLNHLKFRDYLRKHPNKAKEYGQLKKQLTIQCKDDIDLYVEKKTSFITDILQKTGFELDEIKSIQAQNKKLSN